MERMIGLNIYIYKGSSYDKPYTDVWLWAIHQILKSDHPDGVINMYQEVYTPRELSIADGESATLGGALDEARAAASEWLMKDQEF